MNSGLFICFDGPNGSGKTTFIDKICTKLLTQKLKCIKTKEPTTSTIGRLIGNSEDIFDAYTLACLVAADRYNHLNSEIIPYLKKGYIILCDRFLASSLIFQVLDGIDEKYILELNSKIIFPDKYFLLLASEETLNKRLSKREMLSPFEKKFSRYDEIQFTLRAFHTLEDLRINVEIINTDNPIENNIQHITQSILKLWSENNEDCSY